MKRWLWLSLVLGCLLGPSAVTPAAYADTFSAPTLYWEARPGQSIISGSAGHVNTFFNTASLAYGSVPLRTSWYYKIEFVNYTGVTFSHEFPSLSGDIFHEYQVVRSGCSLSYNYCYYYVYFHPALIWQDNATLRLNGTYTLFGRVHNQTTIPIYLSGSAYTPMARSTVRPALCSWCRLTVPPALPSSLNVQLKTWTGNNGITIRSLRTPEPLWETGLHFPNQSELNFVTHQRLSLIPEGESSGESVFSILSEGKFLGFARGNSLKLIESLIPDLVEIH